MRAPMVHGGDRSRTGPIRVRVVLVLALQPAELESLTSQGDDTLPIIGNRMMSAVSIDAEVVEVLSIDQEVYRDWEFPPPSTGFEQFVPLVERLSKKQLGDDESEPWKGDDDGGP